MTAGALSRLALALGLAAPGAAVPWQPGGRADGVDTDSRAAPEGGLEFRGRVVVPADLFETMAILLDEERATRWAHLCVVARVLAQPRPHAFVVYRRSAPGVPWVADRDMVLDVALEPDLARQRLTLAFARRADDRAWPPPGEVVRVPAIRGSFLCDAVDGGHTQVVYQVAVDVGGGLPAWLARRATAELPRQTLLGLRREVARGGHAEKAAALRARLAPPSGGAGE